MLAKLISQDVKLRGCTLIAFLPNLSHTDWYHEYVIMQASRIEYVRSKVGFTNPVSASAVVDEYYLPQIICTWEPNSLGLAEGKMHPFSVELTASVLAPRIILQDN